MYILFIIVMIFVLVITLTRLACGAIPPVIEDLCFLRPPQCNLICTTGYQRSATGGCVCACATDPCQAKLCAVGEHCVTLNSVARCLQNSGKGHRLQNLYNFQINLKYYSL
ncbi:hypothetical protein GCK32_012712 [Trichostrongylus colubriformis]|uniref:Uncharacterized protein n=1 Tax=Trichostrongylus colubriformis TaxID=6319 RepID=A0AAN8F6D7_TRICO